MQRAWLEETVSGAEDKLAHAQVQTVQCVLKSCVSNTWCDDSAAVAWTVLVRLVFRALLRAQRRKHTPSLAYEKHSIKDDLDQRTPERRKS